ncbi:Elongator complex protein 1 [Smittium mucronatum]|uniref:Elongator complex protein 1 n=1 Tax=Smittium mucronatum TaxID=133383 RepID=A0A1R0H0Y8_9FUNG|nr:Elongator complex protein 1 [Smittium mucronatum]
MLIKIPFNFLDFVSVGWGKKETQFHGKEGKLAAQKGSETIKSRLSENEDKSTTICWKIDGSMFSVSFYDDDDERTIQIFSKDGTYICSTEPIECLEQNLAWRSSGSIICGTEKLDHVYRVVLYEQNGLRHYEFNLPKYVQKVRGLYWNSTSEILAILAETKSNTLKESEIIVQFWTCNNYHWYLKNELNEQTIGGSVNSFKWDAENPYLVHLLTNCKINTHFESFKSNLDTEKDHLSSCYVQLSLFTINNVSHVADLKSSASAVVSDFNRLLFTPLGISVVPPPMSLFTLDLGTDSKSGREYSCKSIGMSGFGNGNGFAALLSDGKTINLYDAPDYTKTVINTRPPVLSLSFEIPKELIEDKRFISRQIAWPSREYIILLGLSECENPGSSCFQDSIAILSIDFESSKVISSDILIAENFGADFPLIRLVNNPLSNKTLLISSNGEIFDLVSYPEFGLIKLSVELTEPTPFVDTLYLEDGQSNESNEEFLEDKHLLIVSLSSKNSLWIDNLLVTPTCTSFFLRKDFLIYTTTLHHLQFLPISPHLLTNTSSNLIPDVELKRRIERGATITLVHPVMDSVVLQMPRGNLETIKPRALVLTNIRDLLKNLEFKQAFHLCRTNRVDFSIMFNYDRQLFISNIENIINQISDIDHLCLLVSSFGLTKTSSNKPIDKGYLESNNNDLCIDFKSQLEKIDKIKYLQVITTCLVCQNPPSIEAALLNIKDVGQNSFKVQSDSLSYLLYLVEQKKVYKAALGCYDLELALLVAQKGHSDPREYLTILSKLNSVKMDINYQHYLIDSYLENFTSGIDNLTYWYLSRVKSYLENSNFETQNVENTVLIDGIDDDFNYNSNVEDSWNKLTGFIKKHSLYERSIYLLRPDNIDSTINKITNDQSITSTIDTIKKVAHASYSKLCSIYGHYLNSEKSDFANAAILFMLAEDTNNAIQNFTQAGKWSEALSLATSSKAGFSSHQVQTLARKLADNLISSVSSSSSNNNRNLDAARILLDYTDSIELGIQYLTTGQAWSEAIRNCFRFRRDDLIKTTIYPILLESQASLLSTIEELKEKFEAKVDRLKELRLVPLNKILSSLVPFSNGQDQIDGVDMMSDTASMASQFSVFTVNTTTNTTVSKANSRSTRSNRTSGSRMTSKNRRKEAKKKLRGRKGTIYEESYLVESINRSVIEIDSISKVDVPNMIYALMYFNKSELANSLINSFSSLVTIVNQNIDIVFDNQRQIHTIDDVVCDEFGNPLNPDGSILSNSFNEGSRNPYDIPTENNSGNHSKLAGDKSTIGSLLPKPGAIGFEWKYKTFDP